MKEDYIRRREGLEILAKVKRVRKVLVEGYVEFDAKRGRPEEVHLLYVKQGTLTTYFIVLALKIPSLF